MIIDMCPAIDMQYSSNVLTRRHNSSRRWQKACRTSRMSSLVATTHLNAGRRLVEPVECPHSSPQLLQHHPLFLVDLQYPLVLYDPSGQVGKYFLHGAVRHVLVDRVASLTCMERARHYSVSSPTHYYMTLECVFPNPLLYDIRVCLPQPTII